MNKYTIKDFLEIKFSGAPSFSHDNKNIAYLNNDNGTLQLYLINKDNGEIKQLTNYNCSLEFASFSPVENKILFGMSKDGNERTQFYTLDLQTNIINNITQVDAKHNFGGWSMDGKLISYSTNERNGTDFDVYVHNIYTGERKCLFDKGGWCESFGFSPNNKILVVGRFNSNIDGELFLVSLNNNQIQQINPDKQVLYMRPSWLPDSSGFYFVNDFNSDIPKLTYFNINKFEMNDVLIPKSNLAGVSLTNDGKDLALILNEEGYYRLYVYKVSEFSLLNTSNFPHGFIGKISWSNDGKYLTFSYQNSKKNPDVYVWEKETGDIKQLTNSNCSINKEIFVEPEFFKYKSFDELEIPSFIYYPKNKNINSPTVVYIHGGPEEQFIPSFDPLIQFLLYRGYVVVCPNIRGSNGYGRKYLALDDREKRFDSIRDLEYLYYNLKNNENIDINRIALYGGSYGGYMVLAGLVFQPEFWAAGIDIVGIVNLVTFLKNTSPYRRKLRESEYGYLDKNMDDLIRLSPINYINNLKAPLLVIHGANDPRVPLSEAEQVVEKVKEIGKEAILLVYSDEGHGLSKLKNRLDAFPKVADFLDKHLKN